MGNSSEHICDWSYCDCECHTKPDKVKHAKGKPCPCIKCLVCEMLIKNSAFLEHIKTCVTGEAENEI